MKNLQVQVTEDLSAEPVSVVEAGAWCKVTGSTLTAETSIFNILIPAARKAIEKYTSSSFGEKKISATWLKMPEDWILELPYGPHISIDKVYKIDDEGNETELTVNEDYYVTGAQDLSVQVNQFWSTGTVVTWSIRVEYTAGYGDETTEPLPDDLKLAIMMQVNCDYSFRDVEGATGVLTNAVKAKAAPYRRRTWL